MHHAHSHAARHDCADSLHFELPHRTRAFGIGDIVHGVTEVAKDVVGVGKGVVEGAVDTVTGLAEAVTHPVETVTGLSKLITDPKEAWPAVWHGMVDPIVDDWEHGNQGEAIGRGGWTIFETVFGAKGLTKLGKLGKVGSHADDLPTVPRPVPVPKPKRDVDAPKPEPDVDAPKPDAPKPRAIDAADAALKQAPRTYRPKELNHASKHADDFGVKMRTDPKLVSDSNPTGIATPSNAERAAFSKALEAHVSSPDTVAITGSYRRNPVTFFVNPKSGLTAFYGPDGAFKGGWKLNESQLAKLLDDGYFQ